MGGTSAYADDIGQQMHGMLVRDQDVRREMEKYVLGSQEWKALAQKMSQIDSENMAKLEEIIADHGWPSTRQFGHQSSKAAFLILQHATIEHQKKYLPLVRKAVLDEELSKSSLALLEDRILMREGKDQIYGSQLTQMEGGLLTVWPIENESEVDARRAEVGLEPLAKYLARFGVVNKQKCEQDGADQPAPAVESGSQAKDKSKPETEGRPQ